MADAYHVVGVVDRPNPTAVADGRRRRLSRIDAPPSWSDEWWS
jgi:hypothetical protein